ncbi:MAG: SagB/ThcOx family dehydrogenase [Salinisphaera sp.]|jgi:SagB-type dehydrogenase family enzyme|nr:SagB/ThcOx family dehydrogenase [Salinisphaera sp.]
MTIDLPPPVSNGAHTLNECIRTRRSIRQYADATLSLSVLSPLLWSAQGVTRADGKRTTPTAGGLYPLCLRIIARRVAGLLPGVYAYLPEGHSLEPLAGSIPQAQINAAAIGDQPWLCDAAAVIGVAARLEACNRHFSDQPPQGERGSRYVYMESGALAQNVHLQATNLGLGCVLVGGFDDARTGQMLRLAPDMDPTALLCIGPAATAREF